MPNSIKYKNSGFTLIEVMISSLILSVTVFGILRLSNNNSNQIAQIEKNKEMQEIFYDSKECILSFGFDYLSGVTSTQSLNFGADNTKCLTGIYNDSITFTPIILLSTNDSSIYTGEYWDYYSVTNNIDSLKINNYITDGMNSRNYEFKIYR